MDQTIFAATNHRPWIYRFHLLLLVKILFLLGLPEILTDLNSSEWYNELQLKVSLLSSAVQSDTYYPMDYGFQFTDFLYAVNHSFGAHVKKGLSEYLNERINSGFNQIQIPGNHSHPCINHIENVVDPNRELVKIIDILGRETGFKANKPLSLSKNSTKR